MKEARLRVLPSCQETLEGPISQDQSGPSDLLRLSFLLRSGHRRDTAHVLPAGAPLLHLLPTRGRGIPVPSTPASPLHLRACTSSSSELISELLLEGFNSPFLNSVKSILRSADLLLMELADKASQNCWEMKLLRREHERSGIKLISKLAPGERSWMVSGSAGVVVAATISVCWEVLHPVPGAPLADMLRPDLEVADVGGDAAALVQRGEQVPRPLEGDNCAGPAGLAAEAVADVVDAVLDVVGDLAHLLHPVLTLLVVGDVPLEPAEEGLHAGELVVDVLDVVADAGDEGVLLRQEGAQLVDERLHGAARRADDQIHNQLSFHGFSDSPTPQFSL
uniref:Uncharacterized protein n=1 Tax=Oryza rufipogon TaxID=4529 RepID=A0A0E0RAQ8_ORYRU